MSLSEKELNRGPLKGVYRREAVREAVKRLKEEIKNNLVVNQDELNGEVLFLQDVFEEIDEIFGEKLV